MRMPTLCFLLACVLVAGCASEPPVPPADDPLSGTWTGEWGNSQRRNRVELRLEWDGRTVEGRVNPRSENLDIENASYDGATGELTFEFDAYDNRSAVRYRITGTVDGNTLEGTWSRDGQQGDFHLTRNDR